MIKNRSITGIIFAIFASVVLAGCSIGANVPVPPGDPPAIPASDPGETADEPDDKDSGQKNEEETSSSETGINLIPGADFKDTNSNWGIYTESGGSGSFSVSGGKLTMKISDPGKVAHAVQLYCGGFELLQGAKYAFSADISSDVDRIFEWRIQMNGGDYHPYVGIKEFEIGPEPVMLTSEFVMEESSDPAPRLCFNFGDALRAQGLEAHNIYISNISLVMLDDTNAKKVEKMGELLDVNINQIGYRQKDEKRAVLRNAAADGESFSIVNAADDKVVYEGKVTPGIQLGQSGDHVGYAVFSDYTTPGRYKVRSASGSESYEFDIKDDVYSSALLDSLRMLYLQRCGCELPESLAGDFAHGICHDEEAQIYGSKRYVEVSGGWHDAGDYGRYASPAAKAVADLLLAYDLFPEAFDDNNNIPESGNGIADILDEARYELEWLLKMQADDGGVYHKVTGLTFDGFVKADECTEKLYVFPESKTATADFAGVMFMASRSYRGIDDEFAEKCKNAADRALTAYIKHKDDRNFTNPPEVNTGEYGDGNSMDEFLWAIMEAHKTTGDSKYEKMLEYVDLERITDDDFGWEDMSGYAYYAYLTSPYKLDLDVLKERFFAMCDKYKDMALSGEAYGVTMIDEYPWGSNMYIANNGMALLMAYKLTGNKDYELAAKRQLDYIFGVNCNSYCFLTGYGTQAPLHPHHRPSQAIGKCMKGMLVGGPDSSLEDPYAQAVLAGLPKARCYTDNDQSYSCNEITIYWNSPLVFLLAGFK